MGDVVEIGELEVDDDVALREFFDVDEAAFRVDHPHVVLRTFPQLVQIVRSPSAYYQRTLVVARTGGRIVATGDIGLTVEDNLHLADVQARVHPEFRRRGIGRALHEELVRRAHTAGRATLLSEVNQPLDGESPGFRFAMALGYDVVQQQDHHVLDLPVSDQTLDAVGLRPAGYEVLTWINHAPDHLVGAYAAMHTQMEQDVPIGEVDYQPIEVTVDRIREREARTSTSYDSLVAVARRTADGVLGGYSIVHLAHDADYVIQDDTLVMPDHRGHGLGMALKVANLRILAAEHPERRVIHTWNAVDNTFMQQINTRLGFRPVERELEVQRRDDDA